ncbi:MAG: hypothetical protein II274_00365 [Alistipes sp.]|jgi:hypothetical protein|nr:hypothetical protein [Alistipes sp.]
MKLNYQIDCKHCGTHTEYSIEMRRGGVAADAECMVHIDTECAMRCPACRCRLNGTEDDFLSQVKMVRIA